MRILFLGGTKFVGRAMAESAVAAGHDVTLVHRNPTDVLPDATHVHADRDGDLSALADGHWDATIDVCAYVPRQVATLHDALGDRGGHHVLISTVSVYADNPPPGADEDAPLVAEPPVAVEEVTGETYGGLKVACERVARERYAGDPLTIVRPTYVVGPHDHTGRYPWWVLRAARGGAMVAPGPQDAPMQTIDARDLGAWTVGLAEDEVAGVFTAARPAATFGALLEVTAAATRGDADLVWMDGAWLREQGMDGGRLPMWSEGRPETVLALGTARAEATGLAHRPMDEVVRDTLAWARDAGNAARTDGVGIDAADEQRLLDAWRSR